MHSLLPLRKKIATLKGKHKTIFKTETPFRRQRNAVSRVSKRRLSIALPSPQNLAPQLGKFCAPPREKVFPNYPVKSASFASQRKRRFVVLPTPYR